jgi:hypothetical protein
LPVTSHTQNDVMEAPPADPGTPLLALFRRLATASAAAAPQTAPEIAPEPAAPPQISRDQTPERSAVFDVRRISNGAAPDEWEPGVESAEPVLPPAVPGWIVAPVLAIEIPASPFAAGGIAGKVPAPSPERAKASAQPPAAEPEVTVANEPLPLLIEPIASDLSLEGDEGEVVTPPDIVEVELLGPALPEPEPELEISAAPEPLEANATAEVATEAAAAAAMSHDKTNFTLDTADIVLPVVEPIHPVVIDLSGLLSTGEATDAAAAPREAAPAADEMGAREGSATGEFPRIGEASAATAGVSPLESPPKRDVGSLASRLRDLASHPKPQTANAAQPPLPKVADEETSAALGVAQSQPAPSLPADSRRRVEPLFSFAKRTRRPEPEETLSAAPDPVFADLAIPARRTSPVAVGQNRRLHRRVSLDAEIEIDGAPSRLIDLSMGGFAATDTPPLASDSALPVTLRMTIDGIDISTRLNARIIYAQMSRVGGRFIDLTASQTAFLRYIVTWRGQSVGAIGTTTLLDAIARPDRGQNFDAGGNENPQRQPWWSRWLGRLRVPLLGARQ